MKHAGRGCFDALADLLAAVRCRPGVREPKPGIFYRKGKAWLHFHEDPAGLFADIRSGAAWQRFPVADADKRRELLTAADRSP